MNKEWIEKSLIRIKKQVAKSWLKQTKEFEPTENFYANLLSHKSIRSAAEKICHHIGIYTSPTTEIVGDSNITTLDFVTGRRFENKEIESAADVFSTSLISMKIRIGVHQMGKPKTLGHILAHESTHHFMTIANIYPESDFENEMFTDLTAVYIGFGKLMLNSAIEDQIENVKKPIYMGNKRIPYLDYPLLTYAYFLCQKERNIPREQLFNNLDGPCVSYLKSFEFYYNRKNTFWSKIIGFFSGIKEPPDCNGKIIYEEALHRDPNRYNIIKCIYCNTSLRIPKTDKILNVTCPKCKKNFIVKVRY